MNDYEKLAESFSRINKQMARTSEDKEVLIETLDKVKEIFKTKIGSTLSVWEKEIENGKITDMNIIKGIKGFREQYNAMFANED